MYDCGGKWKQQRRQRLNGENSSGGKKGIKDEDLDEEVMIGRRKTGRNMKSENVNKEEMQAKRR